MFCLRAAILFWLLRKVWRKDAPKRDAFAPLFGNTQQSVRIYGVVVEWRQPLSPRHRALVRQLSEITTALAPERKRGGADIDAESIRLLPPYLRSVCWVFPKRGAKASLFGASFLHAFLCIQKSMAARGRNTPLA